MTVCLSVIACILICVPVYLVRWQESDGDAVCLAVFAGSVDSCVYSDGSGACLHCAVV
jgi:hypothetical protein